MEDVKTDSRVADAPIILFPGMGADPSVFGPQQSAFPNLIVPDWPVPRADDDLASYSARLAADIDPGGPCIVGGASFGGIVAQEVARHLDARACLLIGSVRGPHELPWRIRAGRLIGFGIGLIPICLLQRSAASALESVHKISGPHSQIMRQFVDADAEVLRWSARQILRWRRASLDIPTFQIHGDRDRIFPIRCLTAPDEVIAGGGHVISLTHGDQVNEFLRQCVARFA